MTHSTYEGGLMPYLLPQPVHFGARTPRRAAKAGSSISFEEGVLMTTIEGLRSNSLTKRSRKLSKRLTPRLACKDCKPGSQLHPRET